MFEIAKGDREWDVRFTLFEAVRRFGSFFNWAELGQPTQYFGKLDHPPRLLYFELTSLPSADLQRLLDQLRGGKPDES